MIRANRFARIALRIARATKVVIFFSLIEAPLPDPTQHPEMDPKRTQNRPETEPNRAKQSQTEPKRSQTKPKWTEIKLFGVGRAGVCRGGVGGVVVREKENHYPKGPKIEKIQSRLKFSIPIENFNPA